MNKEHKGNGQCNGYTAKHSIKVSEQIQNENDEKREKKKYVNKCSL